MLRATRHWLLMIGACYVLGAVFAAAPATAAKLSPADLAWIDKCIDDRKAEQLDPTALGKYCACMQGIVDDNEPFTVSELEHSYPPAHAMCSDEAGLR